MIDPPTRARLDQHITAAYAIQYRTIMGGIFEMTSNWMRGFSGLSIPAFNIFHPLTPKGLDDDLLADTAAFFSSQDTLYTVELVHDRFPEGPDYLDKRHYQSLPPQPAMVLENFSIVREGAQLNPSVITERIKNIPSLTAFCTLLHQVFDYPLDGMKKMFPVAHLEKEARSIIRHYLAFDNDQPVGAGSSIFLDDVVSIWHVCTLDAYRRQGVATKIVHRILGDAEESGATVAMLYSTPQAYHLFNSLGFDIYTQRQWFLPPGLHYLDD